MVAQEAAVASLAAYDELAERVDTLVAERGRVIAGLRAQGWDIPDSEANFVWLELGDRTMEFAAAAERAGLVVRPFAGVRGRGAPWPNRRRPTCSSMLRGSSGGPSLVTLC